MKRENKKYNPLQNEVEHLGIEIITNLISTKIRI